MERIALAAATVLLLYSCAPQRPAVPVTAGISPTYSVSIAYPNGQPLSSLTLYSEQFLTPESNEALVSVAISPAVQPAPAVVWSTDAPSIVSFPATRLNCNGCSTPPPGDTYVAMTSTLGAGHVTAKVGPPVNTSVTIPVWTYNSLAVDCAFRYVAAASFDPGLTASGTSSDLYVTQAASTGDPLDPCDNTTFTTGVAAVHFPYGGVLVPGTLNTFPQISASQWSNAMQQAPMSAVTGQVLLFKTKGGRIVKALLPLGPFEVGTGSAFPY